MRISLGALKRIICEVTDEYSKRDELMSVYSDVYKEKNGVRPRWIADAFKDLSDEELEAELNKLYDQQDYYDDDWEFPPPSQTYPDMEGTVDQTDPPDPFEELSDMPTKIPFKGGDEYDALGGNHGIHKYLDKSGARKAAKTSYNRRLRRGG